MSPTPPHLRALESLRSRVGPSLSSAVSSASFRRDVLLGALLSLGVVVLLIAAIYLVLLFRGTFGNPAVPYSLGLLVFALLHGGSASVTVPPTPALLDIGGSALLGLPLTSFALLPFVLLLVSGWYSAQRTGSGAAFALAATAVYAVLVGLLAALGGGSIESGEATIELGAGPLSAFTNAFLVAGTATALGVATAHGPLLPARVRQVVRGALVTVAVSLVLALLIAVVVALLQGLSGATPPAPETTTPEAEGGSFRALLSLLGGLAAIAPSALGTLWLLAHGVPVGVQDPSALAGLPLVGPALADATLRVSLLGTWPYGFGWRLLLLAPVVGLVAGGAVAAQGAPRADRLRQGAAIAVPYTLIALLVAVLARVSADVTLAGASLGVAAGSSLPWTLLLLPVAALLGALGGYVSPLGDEAPAAARPRLAFLATVAACAAVVLLSLPALFGTSPSTGQELLGSAVPGDEPPPEPAPTTDPPEEAPPLEPDPPADAAPTPPQQPETDPLEGPEGGQTEAAVGEILTVGDAEWVVTNPRERNEIRAQGSEEVRQGDFLVVNFEFTNNSDEPVDLSPSSIGLVGKNGRRFEVIPDLARYVPPERDPFARPVEPGATLVGRVIFAVTPKASGFRFQLGNGRPFPPENGYVDLGS